MLVSYSGDLVSNTTMTTQTTTTPFSEVSKLKAIPPWLPMNTFSIHLQQPCFIPGGHLTSNKAKGKIYKE
jgi:hypothetical protein